MAKTFTIPADLREGDWLIDAACKIHTVVTWPVTGCVVACDYLDPVWYRRDGQRLTMTSPAKGRIPARFEPDPYSAPAVALVCVNDPDALWLKKFLDLNPRTPQATRNRLNEIAERLRNLRQAEADGEAAELVKEIAKRPKTKPRRIPLRYGEACLCILTAYQRTSRSTVTLADHGRTVIETTFKALSKWDAEREIVGAVLSLFKTRAAASDFVSELLVMREELLDAYTRETAATIAETA